MNKLFIISVLLFLFVIPNLAFPFPFGSLFQPKEPDVIKVRTIEELRNQQQISVLDFIGLVEQYGYYAEEYQVTTRDGYNLKLHRVSGSPRNPPAFGKPVVFLQHSLLCSSETFVFLGPKISLAYALADAGFDVWLGNVRGNSYSRSHQRFSPTKDMDFWKFSLHETAIYDISKFVDTVLEITHQPKMVYIGYSMGSTLGYMLLSTIPAYNEKISLFISMSTTVFFKNNHSFIINFVRTLGSMLLRFAFGLKFYEVMPQSKLMVYFGNNFCARPMGAQFCKMIFSALGTMKNIDNENMPKILSHYAAGASLFTVDHFKQMIRSGDVFKAYDYGPQENIFRYNQMMPPVYDLSKVTTRVAILYGNGDAFANSLDLRLLASRLPNLVLFEPIKSNNFNHLDFVLSNYASELVNSPILMTIEKFNTDYNHPTYYQTNRASVNETYLNH